MLPVDIFLKSEQETEAIVESIEKYKYLRTATYCREWTHNNIRNSRNKWGTK